MTEFELAECLTTSNVEQAVRALLDLGQRKWPAIGADEEAVFERLSAKIPPDRVGLGSISQLIAADVYLACTLELGDPGAAVVFDSEVSPKLDSTLARVLSSRDDVNEVKQQLRIRLLGPGPEGGRIREYSGRVPLLQWVRLVALRLAMNHKRSKHRERPLDEHLADMLFSETIPEDLLTVAGTRAVLQEALQESFAALSPPQRGLLRSHFLDGGSRVALAKVLRVNRMTVARWLREAREAWRENVQLELKKRLGAEAESVERLLAIVDADLGVSLRTLLASPVVGSGSR